MIIVTWFRSVEEMQRIFDIGMEEGMTDSVNQIGGILAG